MEFKLKKLENCIQVSEIANVHFFQFPKGYKTINDKHPFYELIYAGTGSAFINSEDYNGMLNKHELIIHGANRLHSFSCLEKEETTLIIIGFRCNSDKLAYFTKKTVKLENTQIKQLAEIIKEGRNVFAPPYNVPVYDMVKKKKQVFGSEQMLRSLIETFLIGLIRKYEFVERSETKEDKNFSTNELISYIDNNFIEKNTLNELSFLFCTNRSTLCKQFRLATGQTIGAYIKNKKIMLAKQLITEGKLTITQIAYELNFETVPYFYEFFKQQTGMTPSEYKKYSTLNIEK